MNYSMKIPRMMTLLLILFTLTFSVGYAEAASKIVGYVQTTANLNLREKAAVSSKRLSIIPKGKKMAYYSKRLSTAAHGIRFSTTSKLVGCSVSM